MPFERLRHGRVSESGRIYHITTATQHRHPLFKRPDAATVCCTVLRAISEDTLLCWVLMPDHLHALLRLSDNTTLSETTRRLKGSTARAVNNATERKGSVWQRACWDRAMRRDDDLYTVAQYIIANPVRAGLVSSAQDYPYWYSVWH